MSNPIIFPPLENGLDYMESAVDLLGGSPSNQDLKYGVLHLAAAVEVLLKMRLAKEHWSLIFEDSKTASLARYTSGDFKSVGSEEALRRLRNVASVDVKKTDVIRVKAIVEKRNKLQHFGLNDSVEGIQAVTAGALDFLISFINEQLRDESATPKDPVENALNRIREKLSKIETFVATRMSSLLPKLSKVTLFVSCPMCFQRSLIFGEVCRCLFCLHEGPPETMAYEYVSDVLDISEYIVVKDGGDWPILQCPSCSRETLVQGVIDVTKCDDTKSDEIEPSIYWICFAEGQGWGYGEIDNCGQCGEPMLVSDDGTSMCSDCIAYIMTKES